MPKATLNITAELISAICTGLKEGEQPRQFVVTENGLPEDAKVVSARMSPSVGNLFSLTLESKKFTEGELLPSVRLDVVDEFKEIKHSIKRLSLGEEGIMIVQVNVGKNPPHKAVQVLKAITKMMSKIEIKEKILITPLWGGDLGVIDIKVFDEKKMREAGWVKAPTT